MATEKIATLQGTIEVRTHYVDFTHDLPSGVTVSSATAVHFPPSGSTVTPTVGAIVANVVPVTVPQLIVTGRHIVSVRATLSDTEVIEGRLIIPVQWDVARTGVADLVNDLRMMADVGMDDYKIAGIPHWTDSQLERILDRHRTDVLHELCAPQPTYITSGSVAYYNYYTGYINWESGNNTYLEDAVGDDISGTLYDFDYQRGLVAFDSDRKGSTVFITGNVFDLNAAAADVWRMKASNAGKMYDFSTDNHKFSRSQYYDHCIKQAQYYEGLAAPNNIQVYREDCIGAEDE